MGADRHRQGNGQARCLDPLEQRGNQGTRTGEYGIMADISDLTSSQEWQKCLMTQTEAERLEAQERLEARQAWERQAQASFIAAYTDREPADVTAAEVDNCQQFWNTHAQATADILAAGIDGIGLAKNAEPASRPSASPLYIDQMLKHWLTTDTVKCYIFHGADLKAAYLQYDAEGQELVKSALAKPDNELSRRYVKAAILPAMESGFIATLGNQTISRIKTAIKTTYRPPACETSTFWLFCLLFELADDDRKEKMAAAIGIEPDAIATFLQRRTIAIPEPIVFKAIPKPARKETEAELSDAAQPERADAKRIKEDANTIRLLARHNSNSQYDVSMDISVFALIGQDFEKTITDDTGYVDFYMHLPEREFSFPYLLEAEDILIAIAWDSIRMDGGRYITPLDIWHKVSWGVTGEDSKDSETEKKLLAKLKVGQGTLQNIVDKVERLMHLETIYRVYKTKKTAQDRKPVDLKFEYKNTFIPYAGRVKVPGYKNIVIWETALRNPNEKWDGYTSLPYRAAVSSGRLISLPASQIDLRRLGINSTLHIATIRDTVLRMVLNAQSHGGHLEIRNIDNVYQYGRLDAKKHLELEAAADKGADKLRTVKDKQRKRRNTDAQTLARMVEGLQKTGVLKTAEIKGDGQITAQTAIAFELDRGKGRKGKKK